MYAIYRLQTADNHCFDYIIKYKVFSTNREFTDKIVKFPSQSTCTEQAYNGRFCKICGGKVPSRRHPETCYFKGSPFSSLYPSALPSHVSISNKQH